MLQSPKFLFHVAGRRTFATSRSPDRLSYLLWDTMPDRALMDAAARGELRTPEGLERTARAMLQRRARGRLPTSFSASG